MLKKFQFIPDTYQEETLETEMYVIGYMHRDPCRVCVSNSLVCAVNNSPKGLRHLFKAFFTEGCSEKYI